MSVCVVAPATAQADSACAWKVQDLPLPQGVTQAEISDADPAGGWVVATARSGGQDAAVVWHDNAVARSLKLEPGDSITTGVNRLGTALEYSYDKKSSYAHFANGDKAELPARVGDTESFAVGINAAGDIVGHAVGPNGRHVVVWPAATPGLVSVVAETDNGNSWLPIDIDDEGRILAQETKSPARGGYVFDSAGHGTRLEPLPGHTWVRPVAFRGGRIVGYSAAGFDGPETVVAWGLDGRVVRKFDDLALVRDVNASGHVLGSGTDYSTNLVVGPSGRQEVPIIGASELTDSGDLYGVRWDDKAVAYVPTHVVCG
ncbi:hypothetical protein Lesp02_19350 [Lentzea sp. NBRC 105346]|nr:hypothetical protein Lesp02_19350 [Lentzea sp. NBRC 105346]